MQQQTGGVILRGVGGLYEIRTDDGAALRARARGNFRHAGQTPLVGDRVRVAFDERPGADDGGAVICEILPRRNAFIRPPMANLDVLFVVMAAADPAPMPDMADKLIAIAEHGGTEPVIVIGKRDLAPDTAEGLCALYRRAGFAAFALSAKDGAGVAELAAWLSAHTAGKIAAFAGASGVGKSTLLNRLFPSLSLETGEISRKTARGKHTTRRVELYPIAETGALIADTPGFSLLDFIHFDFFTKDDLPFVMREFAPYLGKCRYAKCSHTKEEGCAVLAAVRRGDIAPSRHASFCAMYADLKDKREWDKK